MKDIKPFPERESRFLAASVELRAAAEKEKADEGFRLCGEI